MTLTQSSTRLVAVAAGVAVALALMLGASMPVRAAALSQTQIQSILNLLTSFGADSATLNNVSAALNGTAMTGGSTGGTSMAGGVCPFTWSRSLQAGSKGADIMALQKFLNMSSGTMVAASGAGSAGMETSTFGPATKKAVMKFQAMYGISQVGNVGPMTRAKLNSLCTSGTSVTPTPTPTPGTPGTPTPVGSATVSAGAQPANAIAPQGASRVPYTAFTVTAGAAPVTLNSVTVMRQGPSVDTDFAGVILVDSVTGMQLGTSRVLDANHSATIGSAVVIPAGTSKTFWVEGNIATLSGNIPGSGDVASFAVTAVNTNATVSGALPIVGASNTINTALTIGTATINNSSFDPSTSSSQPIGTSAYRFTGLRIQGGSAEDVTFKSITWYQAGSASGLGNVVTVVNGTSYPTVLDASGRYYSTVFPTGIVIPKGQSVDVYVQGDLASNTTANTYAEFDIYRSTDIYLTGNTYGFGITPSVSATTGSYSSASSHNTIFIGGTNTPWMQGSTVTVTGGTFSTIQNASSVGAQNIAVNVANQPLGGFMTNLTGEPIQVQSLTVRFLAAGVGALQNVSLVNESGAVVAGPYNAVADNSNYQHVTFSGAVTFPTGSHTYTLKGQVPSGTTNGTTIQATTSPATDWTNVTGQTSGNNVALSGQTTFSMNTMTVQAAAVVVSNGTTPSSQTVVAGGQNIQFASVNLDASQSGEDTRLSSLPLTLTPNFGGLTTDLSGCQIWNGTTALNTGSRVINGANIASATPTTFSFDNGLTIPKGTVLVLTLTCNLNSAAAAGATYSWTAAPGASFSVTGVTSGSSVTIANPTGTAPTMTASAGATLAASTDSSAPSYAVVAGGSTGITANVIKLRSTNEAVNLQKLGLKLTSGSAADVTKAYIYTGNNVMTAAGTSLAAGTLIGTVFFSGSTSATSTLTQTIQLPVNVDATLVVKADIADIGTSQPGTEGDLVAVDYDSAQGVGANSGKTINGAKAAGFAGVAGVRMLNTFPVIALGTISSSGVSDGNLMRFTVTADSHGPVGLNQFTFTVNPSSGTTVASPVLYAFSDSSYSTPASGTTGGGVVGSTAIVGTAATTTISTPFQVTGTTYFQLRGTVTPSGTTYNVNTTLLGDSTFAGMSQASVLTGANHFVWSPNATGTSATTNADWTNGAGITGLPSVGLNQNRTQ